MLFQEPVAEAANLENGSVRRAELSSAPNSGSEPAHLPHSSLRGADISGANLSGVDLSFAPLANRRRQREGFQGLRCQAVSDVANTRTLCTRLMKVGVAASGFR